MTQVMLKKVQMPNMYIGSVRAIDPKDSFQKDAVAPVSISSSDLSSTIFTRHTTQMGSDIFQVV